VTDGYSGADLQALVYNAHLNAVHESISETGARNAKAAIVADSTQPVPFTTFGGPEDQTILSYAEQSVQDRRVETIVSSLSKRPPSKNATGPLKKSKPIVTSQHLQQSLKSTRPSISPEERARLSLIYRSFISERGGNLPVPPSSSGIGSRASLG